MSNVTFEKLTKKIGELSYLDGVSTRIIGRSANGRAITAFHVGNRDGDQVIITAAIHAREWITALLVVELVKIYARADITAGGIYFVPLCNPDGVQIALGENPLWKANARGVDLNVNFDADWGGGAQNVRTPGPENYIGPHPASEPEVAALVDFTMKVEPKATVAYHSKGEVIYHGFESTTRPPSQRRLLRDRRLAKRIGKLTGYAPVKTENSTGGYCDWVSINLGIPAFTIEVGKDEYTHPITEDKLPEILMQNNDVPRILLIYLLRFIHTKV